MCGKVKIKVGGFEVWREVHDYPWDGGKYLYWGSVKTEEYDPKIHGQIFDWLDVDAPMLDGRATHQHSDIEGTSGHHGYKWLRK